MFSQTLEYALRAVICLAQQDPQPMTTTQICQATMVPSSYLSKVLQQLVRAELVNATRGIGGGYVLNVRPGELTILRVVNAIEPIKRINTCPLGIKGHGVHLCPLHHRMDKVIADAEAAFAATTFSELLNESTSSTPLCNSQPAETELTVHQTHPASARPKA